MKICIFGAGAMGSMYGGELARAGHHVTLITRGPHLAAIRANGLTVGLKGEERHTRPDATDDASQPGPQDLVIFTLKGHHVPGAAMDAAPLLAEVGRRLREARLEAVLIGNAAAALQGAPVTTVDFDFLFRKTSRNLAKLKAVARGLGAVIMRP